MLDRIGAWSPESSASRDLVAQRLLPDQVGARTRVSRLGAGRSPSGGRQEEGAWMRGFHEQCCGLHVNNEAAARVSHPWGQQTRRFATMTADLLQPRAWPQEGGSNRWYATPCWRHSSPSYTARGSAWSPARYHGAAVSNRPFPAGCDRLLLRSRHRVLGLRHPTLGCAT